MKKILSLCIKLLLLIISDAVPHKLIAGNHSVVKKDGATHNITKYYVVPNDFDANKNNNGSEGTQKTVRSIYSKSMQSNDGQVSENKTTDEPTDKTVNFGAELYDADHDEYTIKGIKESVIATRRKATDDLGNLQVKPINNSYKINVNVTANESNVGYKTTEGLQNRNSIIVENATHNSEREFDNSTFGTAVREACAHNLDSFWKLLKFYIDTTSDKDELLAKIERLSLLLNIFTFLYEDALLKMSSESMVDSITDILQIPFVAKSKSNGDESKTNIFGRYSEEYLRTYCDKNHTKPQLDSNGNYLSEAGGREANDNLKLENPDLQRRERQESNNDWIKTSSDSDSHQVTVSNKPTIIGNTQNLPKVYNRLSVSTLNVDDNENLENQTSLDSAEISRKIDYLLSSIKSRVGDDSEQIEGKMTDNLPWYIEDRTDDNLSSQIEDRTDDNLSWHVEDRTDDNLSWHVEDRTDDNLSWHVEDRTDDNLSWHVEDRTDDNLSWHVEDRTDDNLSWHVEDRTDDNLSWQIEDRTDDNLPLYAEDRSNNNFNRHVENRKKENLPWHIEDKEKYQFLNKITHKPITVYKSSSSHSLTKNGGKILMHSSKPRLTSTVHTVEVQNGIKKPYHILYATNPEMSVHKVQNIHEVKSPNIHLAAISGNDFKTSTSHSGIKVVNKPSSSFYTSQILSNQPSNPHLKYTNTVSTTYNISNTVNPSDLLFVDHGTEIFSTESQTKSHTEHKAPEVLFPNVPINPYDSLLNNEPVSISSSAIADTSDEISDFVNQLKKINGNSNINLNFKPQANLHEDPISKAIKYTKYEEIEEDLSEPTTVYEKETKISKVQHYPEYIKAADNYGDLKLVYDIETEPQRHLIAQTTSQSQSEYTEVGNDDNDSIPIYSGETHSFVSKAPSTSAITNIDYIKVTPDYGHTDKQTHSISKLLHYPEYETVEKEKTTTVQVTPEIGYAKSQQLPLISNVLYYPENTEIEKSDKTTSVHGGEIGKQSHYISKTKSEYTEIPSDYINVAPDYGTADQKQQPLISNVLYYPEHSEIEKEDDETTLVHGGEIGKQSHYISKTKSEYTNIPSEYDIYPYPSLVPYVPNNSEYTEIEKDSKHEHIIKPSLFNVHRPAKLNYLKQKLAPSYQLFTVENLLKLQNGITKTIEINGPKLNNDIALINLKKIVNIIVLLAEHLGETAGSNKWYEKIFYITKDNRHPLQLYAHNLLRQRWLHELLSLLYKNNFNLKILQNPGIFSFLGSWKFPQYVQDFLDAQEMIESDFYEPNGFDDTTSYDTFSTHAFDDIFAKVPDDLENYLTDDVINNYKSLDDDLVLGIAGLDAEPDAKKVTQILQKYLLQKSIIEKQENVIIRDNKVLMLKHVISFLKQKGYDALTISNLIRKLYTAVHSTEGKGCHIHHTNFAKNMYNVILPVLRSAGR